MFQILNFLAERGSRLLSIDSCLLSVGGGPLSDQFRLHRQDRGDGMAASPYNGRYFG